MTQPTLPKAPVECVVFSVGGTRQALPIAAVREILVPGQLTPAPGAACGVLGLTQVRGRALPVIDLAARLGLGAAEPDPQRRLVVIATDAGIAALLVESVDEVATVAPADFEVVRVPGSAPRLVVKRKDALVGWLDPDDLLHAGYEREALVA